MRGLAILYGACALQMALWTVCGVALATAVGARVTHVTLGPVPIPVTRRIRGVALELTPWPASSVAVLGRARDDRDASPRGWRQLGLARRLVAMAGPWLAVFAVAIATLGPAHAARSLVHGVSQLLFVLDPTPLVREVVRQAAHAPFASTIGVVFAKLTAFNLLPAPMLGGGGVIAELLRGRGFEPDDRSSAARAWTLAGLVLVLWVAGRFAFAFVHVLAT